MKRLLGTFVIIGCYATLATAQSRYVTTSQIPIDMRSGPSNQHRVVADLEEATPVQIFETSSGWSRIRLEGGKEGWVLSRFLTDQMPCKAQFEKLQQEHASLIEKAGSPLKEIQKLRQENDRLQASLSNTEKNFDELSTRYETLKTESADFLKVKNNYEEASTRLAEQTEKADRLEKTLSTIKFNEGFKWFLGGGGVLFVGFILGFATKRQKKRSSLL